MKQTVKINALIGIIVFLCTSSYAQTKSRAGFTIKGTIQGVRSGKIVLTGFSKGIDSTVIKNGTFTLKGKLNAPEMMTLQVKPGNWIAHIFVENSVITVKADTTGVIRGQGDGAELTKVKVSGSVSQNQYSAYENDTQQQKFKMQYKTIRKNLADEKDPEKRKKLQAENSALSRSERPWQLQWINNFITKNPTSTVGAYLFADYHKFDFETSLAELEALLNKFSGTAKESVYYADLSREVNAKLALSPGHKAPDFTLLKKDSTKLTLSSTRGKYVMIDFWASWCHPCRKAIPHWKEVYQKYHDKGFEIISVSMDESQANWTKAMDEEKMPWPQVVDDFSKGIYKLGGMYQISYIPFYVLLNQEGKILVYAGEEKKVEDQLEQLLK